MTTTIAMIGTGLVGERIINQALENGNYEIIALYDENLSRLQEIANKYHLPEMTSLEQLLALNADWIYIGTPPASHAILTEKIAALGYNILSEKPLAHNMTEGQKMVDAVQQAEVKSAMHFPMMYSPEVRTLKKALENNDLGNILRIELHVYLPHWPRPWQQNNWIATRQQGGFIREIFPHYLQLANHLFGGLDIVSHETVYPENINLSELSVIALAKTLDDIPMLINGVAGVAQEERIDFKVLGTKKSLTIRNWSELWESSTNKEEQQVNIKIKSENFLQACHQVINGEDALIIPFEEGLKVQYWIDELLN